MNTSIPDSESDFIYPMKEPIGGGDVVLIRLPKDKDDAVLPYLNEDHRNLKRSNQIPNSRYLSSQTQSQQDFFDESKAFFNNEQKMMVKMTSKPAVGPFLRTTNANKRINALKQVERKTRSQLFD